MINALLVIFEPVAAWDRIARARRSIGFIVLMYLLPTLMIASALEGYSLVRWGRERGRVEEVMHAQTFTRNHAIVFEVAQTLLLILVVFIGAKLVKSVGETFHGRHTYTQAFTAVAYGFGPLYLLRLLDFFPKISPLIGWSIGMVLTVTVLYHGMPRIMEPDPSHALGFFFMGSLLLVALSAMVRFVTYWYLIGHFGPLEAAVTKFAASLPF